MSALAAVRKQSDKARLIKAATGSPEKKVHSRLCLQLAQLAQLGAARLAALGASADSSGLQERPAGSDSEPEHKESLVERVEAEVRAEIDRAEHRKVPTAEARIVAYSDSDSEEDLTFKRSSRRVGKDGSAAAPDHRRASLEQGSTRAWVRELALGGRRGAEASERPFGVPGWTRRAIWAACSTLAELRVVQ